jgi:ribokinase
MSTIASVFIRNLNALRTPTANPSIETLWETKASTLLLVSSVVVLGSINMDLVVRVPRLPLPGDTVLGDRLLTIPGGKGANQAVAAARLGAPVRMVGRVGGDAFGRELLAGLRDDRVDVAGVAVDEGAPSGAALIVVEDDGQNTVTVAPGANGMVGADDVQRMAAGLRPGDVVVLQLEVPYAAVGEAIDAAHRAGARVILNAAPSTQMVGRPLPHVDVLVVNERESEDLGGAEKLRLGGDLVVTLGARGAVLYQDGAERHVEPRRVKAVDATAAGDAFVGALAFALARGNALPEAVELANAAGAAAVTRLGARPSLPTARELGL